MSTPVPSPSMKGMIGSLGTASAPSAPMVMISAMDRMLRGGASASQLPWLGGCGPQHRGQPGDLFGVATKEGGDPTDRLGGVDLGPPSDHFLNVEPVLGAV